MAFYFTKTSKVHKILLYFFVGAVVIGFCTFWVLYKSKYPGLAFVLGMVCYGSIFFVLSNLASNLVARDQMVAEGRLALYGGSLFKLAMAFIGKYVFPGLLMLFVSAQYGVEGILWMFFGVCIAKGISLWVLFWLRD
jgi:hypothetical protein